MWASKKQLRPIPRWSDASSYLWQSWNWRNESSYRMTWVLVAFFPPCEGAVNLAGENLMNTLRWWNDSYKKDLFSSRIDTTRALAQAISSPPCAWVLVTGVACYRPSQMALYTEETEWTPFDLLSQLVKEWEGAGRLSDDVATKNRQVVIRPGAVLGRDGGAMKRMLTPFWLGFGGMLGSGRQPFPWIHVSDLAGIITHSLEALLGAERAVVLTDGQRVAPKRTLESGYEYQYPDLQSALREIVNTHHPAHNPTHKTHTSAHNSGLCSMLA
ncbi:hypothetical protein AAFF_G00336440 [Aldrovandia affinis]|uniref:DUF1731 domain-containing protein n=1 Tax=Aldrovandia affinis TaxID=143900 RepID=A0AAD7R641_9TELE|nr:hypothetical protein AAFF_G00336440 [Aldrovandia affinis]